MRCHGVRWALGKARSRAGCMTTSSALVLNAKKSRVHEGRNGWRRLSVSVCVCARVAFSTVHSTGTANTSNKVDMIIAIMSRAAAAVGCRLSAVGCRLLLVLVDANLA